MRRFVLLLLTNALILTALAATVWFDNERNRGITFTPAPRPVPWADGPLVGVNAFNLHLEPDPEALTHTLQLAHELGARFVRMQVPWDDIEIHGRGDFEDRRNLASVGAVSAWAKYDRIVATARHFDIELIMRLERPPAWAREVGRATPAFQAGLAFDGNSIGPPDDLADYGNFVRTLVRRYQGQVRFFQIWNEPNLKVEWGWREPRPAEFVALLKVGYQAVKAANPAALVLFPSLSPVDGLDSRAPMTELEYLDAVYAAGGGAFFDIMSAQAYGLGQPPDEHRYVRLRPADNRVWSRPLDTRADVSRVVLLHEVMVRNGDSAKPVWIGEFGWNSAPERIPSERRFTWGAPVSEALKADYIVGQIERARREWPWLGVMNLWMLRYGGYQAPDPADPTPYFALVQRDWTPLPAYTRLRDYLHQPTVAGVGAHTWAHPAVERTASGWRVRFNGQRLTLAGASGDALRIRLDDQPIEMKPTSIEGLPALITPTLADSTHILEVRGASPPEWFIIARDPPAPWFWNGVPALLLVILLVVSGATMQALGAIGQKAT